MVFRNLLEKINFSVGLLPARNSNLGFFLAQFGPLALEKTISEHTKTQLPGARGTVFFGGGSGHPKNFSSEFRNLSGFSVLADWTPTGGKSQSTGLLGHFGPGRPLALRDFPGGKLEN